MPQPRVVFDNAKYYLPDTQLQVDEHGAIIALAETTPGAKVFTRSVRRGKHELAAAGGLQLRDGRLVRSNTWLEERIDIGMLSVEQSWHFATPPAGLGPLEVTVAVESAADVVVSDHGFYLAHDERGLSYSHATWIDASGKRLAVTGTYDGDAIRFVVPEAVVMNAAYPAVLDPTVTGEGVVGTQVNGSPTGANSGFAGLASSGSAYVAVWRDHRAGNDGDIFATRLNATGTPMDVNAVAVSTAAGVQGAPVATYAGSSYVLVWEDYKFPAADADIRAAALNPATGVVTQIGAIAATGAAETLPAVAAIGGTALIAYQSGSEVRATVYSGTFGATVIVAAVGKEPSVAANPSGNFLVTYSAIATTVDALYGQLVSPSGALVGAAFVISQSTRESRRSSAAFVGGNFVAAWTTGGDIWGTRVTPAGVVLDTHLESTVAVGGKLLVSATNTQDNAVLACNATCLLTWQDRRAFATQSLDTYVQAYDATLTASAAEAALGDTGLLRAQTTPRVAASSSGFLAAWTDSRVGGPQYVMGTPVTGGVPTTPAGIVVPRSVNRQSLSAGTTRSKTNGTNFAEWFLFWGDSRNVGDDIVGQLVDSNGNVAGAEFVPSNAANQQQGAAGTYDGANWLTTWTDARGADFNVYAARVEPTTGAIQDPAGIPICTAVGDQFVNSAASNELGASLIVWFDRRSGNFDIYGAIVNPAGTVAVADIPIAIADGDQISPWVTWDAVAGVFIVVWSDGRTGVVGGRDIRATRVSTAGAVLDPASVVVSNAADQQVQPGIATIGSTSVVVWEDRRSGTADVYSSRLTANTGALVVVDPAGVAISTATAAQTRPVITVAYKNRTSRRRFVTVWTDTRTPANLEDIYGAIIEPSTGQRVGSEFVVSANTSSDTRPAALGGMWQGNAVVMIMYQKYVAALRTTRVYVRTIQFTATEI